MRSLRSRHRNVRSTSLGLIHKVHRAHSPKREEGRSPETSLHGGCGLHGGETRVGTEKQGDASEPERTALRRELNIRRSMNN